MKIIYTGLESSGKTLLLAKKIKKLLYRNKLWKKKYGFTRQIWSNLILSENFYKKNKEYINYWYDYKDLIDKSGIDIIWDEISTDFSALKKEPLPKIVNRWLRQGAKQGIEIYATAQEYHDVHLDMRRRCFKAFKIRKLIGSRRGGDNMPPVKNIWGLCIYRQLKIHPYNELVPEYSDMIPSLLYIGKELCNIFDTRQVIKESLHPPYDHVERKCLTCGFKRVEHR